MVSQLKEFFKLKNLLGSSLIPLLAFLVLGYVQRNIYDWTQLRNRGYERGIEIAGYLLVYVFLYVIAFPLFWLRPQLTAKLYKEGSSQAQPETSQVFDLSDRQRIADITMELEFAPSFWTRKCIERMDKKSLGIKLTWNPRNLFACSNRYRGDEEFCNITENGILLFPFEKMNLEDSNSNFVKYSFRFALGTTEVVQQTMLRANHLNWKSRFLFGLNSKTEFLFDIKDSRARDEDANVLPGQTQTPALNPASTTSQISPSEPQGVSFVADPPREEETNS